MTGKIGILIVASVLLAGCQNMNTTQQRALSGGAIGAAGGAAIGAAAGGPGGAVTGTVIGGAGGAAVGAATTPPDQQ